VIAAAALVSVLTTSLLCGVLIGAVISIVLLLRRASEPPVAVAGRIPATKLYGNIGPNPENLRIEGAFVFRADTAILYFTCEFLYDRFLERLALETGPVKLAIWSFSTAAPVDLVDSEMLVQLRDELAQRGIRLKLADARGPVREDLRAARLEASFGPIEVSASIAGNIRAKGS
jgi:MFS superfamily sulfate permease-like transporter